MLVDVEPRLLERHGRRQVERHVDDVDHITRRLVVADGGTDQGLDLLELGRLKLGIDQLARGIRHHAPVHQHRDREAPHPAADLGVVAHDARDLVVDRLLAADRVLGRDPPGVVGSSRVRQVVADGDVLVPVALGRP